VFALYLLIDFDRIVNKVEQLIPRRWSPGISSVARDIHKTLSGYVRGQLTANVVLAALYATGFSGHGFLMGPAIGEVMRDLYLGRSPVVDVSPLTADRFACSGLRPELNIV
jgi:predicted PurR-regulated permease PerM